VARVARSFEYLARALALSGCSQKIFSCEKNVFDGFLKSHFLISTSARSRVRGYCFCSHLIVVLVILISFDTANEISQ